MSTKSRKSRKKQPGEETVGKVAGMLGIPYMTLRSAIDRGDVKSRKLDLGTTLVDVASAEEWARGKHADETRGRK